MNLETELKELFGLTLHGDAWGFYGQKLTILEQLDDPNDVIEVLKKVRLRMPFNEICVLVSKPLQIVCGMTPPVALTTRFHSLDDGAQVIASIVKAGGRILISDYQGCYRLQL